MTLEDLDHRLADQIVACMCGDLPHPVAIDLAQRRLLAIGDGPDGTHVSPATLAEDQVRYRQIPARDRIESLDHVRTFLRSYRPREPQALAQAVAAAELSETAEEWRELLTRRHDAVTAFEKHMFACYHVIARILMHDRRRGPISGAPSTPRPPRQAPTPGRLCRQR